MDRMWTLTNGNAVRLALPGRLIPVSTETTLRAERRFGRLHLLGALVATTDEHACAQGASWCVGADAAQTARFFSLRRSRSDSPPQIPKRSSCSSAYSRHSARTSQPRHTRFASRVDPPFS